MYIHCFCGSALITPEKMGGNAVLCLQEEESPAGWMRDICVELENAVGENELKSHTQSSTSSAAPSV